MKFVRKTYLLLSILIAAAIVNLALISIMQQDQATDSFSLVLINNLKVEATEISSLASSIAAGNNADRNILQQKINEVDSIFPLLENGGVINGNQIVSAPVEVSDNLIHSYDLWNRYKDNANAVKMEPVFNAEVRESINYVLNRNSELILLNKQLSDELENLDRNYRRHQEIASDLIGIIENMNADVLLISLGDDAARNSLQQNRLMYDINLRKLLGLPLDDLDIGNIQVETESLSTIPEENSSALEQMDPLWESIRYRILTIESNSLVSEKFGNSLRQLNQERVSFLQSLDELFNSWDYQIQQKIKQNQNILGMIVIGDTIIFLVTVFSVRQSLRPLQKITFALSKVKEGHYGEKISHNSKDEIGEVINMFNVMSQTMKKRDDEDSKISSMKDEFLAMITHELKTPLVPIQGYADILLTEVLGSLNEKQKERLFTIKESSSSLLRLISDLLDAQKLELGKIRMIMKKNSTEKILSKTVEIILPKTKGTEISIKHIKTKNVNIVCDEHRLIQVLVNLIKNSIDAIGQQSGIIEIFSTDFVDKVQFTVKDTGEGIPEEAIPHLFEKFYQTDSSLTREKGGSGLGLSICKGILDAHSGRIWLEQKPNDVRFCFTIPKNLSET